MKLTDVRGLTPAERFYYWILEREAIRSKKESGRAAPWTDDEILRGYRFCNVRRMDDRVSKWLLANWYRPNRGHPNMLVACALARFINRPASLEVVGFPRTWDAGEIKRRLRGLRDAGNPVFNAAYVVRGNDGADKIASVVDYYVKHLYDNPPPVNTESMEETWGALRERYGFGSFMAGQVTADLRWAVTGSWADKNYWAPAGPGSLRGIARLLGSPVSAGRFPAALRGVIRDCLRNLPAEIALRLEAMDYQNCLCEFDKYERALGGEGRPKQLYRGGSRP